MVDETSDKYPVDSEKLQRYLSDAARAAHIAAVSMADAVRAYRNAKPPKLPRKTWRSPEVGQHE